MLVFSKEFLIYKDKIISKNMKKQYSITKEIYTKLQQFNDTDFLLFESNKPLEKFLLDEQIIVKGNEKYYPFVNKEKISRVFIQLTDKCNLKCKHCYAEGCPQNNSFIDYEALKIFLSKAINYGIINIDFTGGEIFTYPKIFNLLEWLSNKPVQVMLFTNLTLLKSEDIIKLSQYKCIKKIATSLDYYTAEKHNLFRGGIRAHEKTISNIQLLNKLGVKVIVNSMVLDDNHAEIEKLVNHCVYKMGVSINLDNLLFEGRIANKGVTEFQEKKNALVVSTLVNQIHRNQKTDISKLETVDEEIKFDFCGVGDSMIFITAKEEIALCPSLTHIKMNKCIDQINDFKEIECFLQNFLNLTCKHSTCEKFLQCNGGCRARALQKYGDIYERDPIYCYKLGVK